MNKYIAMVILKPDIKERKIDFAQNDILNLFEQNTRVTKVYNLGKRKLDFYNKRFSEGIYLKIELVSHSKKIDRIRNELRKNDNIISSVIMINDNKSQNKLSVIKDVKNKFLNKAPIRKLETTQQGNKMYMLVSKNLKLPFNESEIVEISDNRDKLMLIANKKIQEYIYAKGFRTLKPFKVPKDIENELRRTGSVKFSLGNNPDVGQELLIQEKYAV